MTITSLDIQTSFGLNILCAIMFWKFQDNSVLQSLYQKIKWFWVIQLVIAFVPDEIYNFPTKAIKLFIAYGFGFDFFVLAEGGRKPNKSELYFRMSTSLIHHLIVLCNDNYIEMICYSFCWSVHIFVWKDYLGGYKYLVPMFKIGNHLPIIVLFQYAYFYQYKYKINPITFWICIQMVMYRYIYTTSSYSSYGLMAMEPFKTYLQKISKNFIYILAIGTTIMNLHISLIIAASILVFTQIKENKVPDKTKDTKTK